MCDPITLSVVAGSAAGMAGTAGVFGTAMTAAQSISLGLSVAGSVASTAGAYQQTSMARKTAEHNAQVADIQAQDALRRGDEQAGIARRQAGIAVGQARAGYGARGVDIGAGTPGDVAAQLDFFGESDAATARMNAGREAWAYRNRAEGFRADASAANPLLASATTLLGSAAPVADKWYRYGGR